MKTKMMLLSVVLVVSCMLMAQTAPDPAGKILDAAYKKAKAEKKNVMVVFHASWCGWCKKFDASVNDPSCKDYFDKTFVFIHLTILESADKKNLENPGAMEIFDNNGGKGGGIPYFLIYDNSGKLLADSKYKPAKADAKPANMGCPASDEEVAAFVETLKKTSKISDAEIAAITERFKKNR
jgi:thioredoxin-related protein